MIEEALDASTGNLRALAAEIGVSYETLWAWKSGRRTPGAENRRRLAEALAARGAKLLALAAEIEETVGKRLEDGEVGK
jgi:transcriptional regulator with XRE-family HTH domain